LRQRADRPAAVASRAFHQLLYGPDHPYGSDPQGTPESLGAIVRDELVQFHAAHVGPVHSTMVVVGPYSQEESREAITELFDAWGQSPSVAPPHLALTDERPHPLYIVDRPGAVQTEIRFGRAGYSRTSPEYVALTVANRILGGQFTSRLNANLREKRGWTYGIGSSFRFHRGPGPFVISTAVDSARTGEALDEIIGELRRLCEGGCTEEEVQSARTGLSGGFVVGLETPAQYAAALAGAAMFDLGPDYLETHREQLSRITVDEVNAAARRSLWPDDMTIVLHGDRGMLEAQKSITAFRPVAVDIGTIMGTSRRQ
jgi:zinc protease